MVMAMVIAKAMAMAIFHHNRLQPASRITLLITQSRSPRCWLQPMRGKVCEALSPPRALQHRCHVPCAVTRHLPSTWLPTHLLSLAPCACLCPVAVRPLCSASSSAVTGSSGCWVKCVAVRGWRSRCGADDACRARWLCMRMSRWHVTCCASPRRPLLQARGALAVLRQANVYKEFPSRVVVRCVIASAPRVQTATRAAKVSKGNARQQQRRCCSLGLVSPSMTGVCVAFVSEKRRVTDVNYRAASWCKS
jgi:hypothetical protein